MSSSCRRRSRLNSLAMLSKVSSTLGLSSASMAASDIEFSRSSSSISASPIAASSAACVAIGAVHRLRLERRRGRRRRRRRYRLRRLRRKARHAGNGAGRRGIAGRAGRRHVLGVGTGIGRLKIDDVAEKDFSFVELVAPDDDGLEGQRALAQSGDHRLAAGLDALGDGDFALAGQQLDRAHFAQIHPHRVVGALGRLLGFGLGRRLRRDLDQFAALGLLFLRLLAGALFLVGVGFLGLDDVDAHLAHHRQHVLDLLGGDFLRRHDRVELFVGDVAALLGLLDHLLDGGVREIEQRQRCVRRIGGVLLRRLTVLLRGGLLRREHLGLARNGLGSHALDRHFYLHERPVPTAARHCFVPTLWGCPRFRGRLPCRAPTLWSLSTAGGPTGQALSDQPGRGLQSPSPRPKRGSASRRRPNQCPLLVPELR